jgi:signal transduction histidine kinase
MARELHDALTQTLFGARLAIQTASAALAPENAAAVEHLERAEALVTDAFGELRALIEDLRPPDLENDRLTGAARKQLALLERTSDLAVDLDVAGDASDLDPETERQVFRILQEAVANVVRHARASSLTVSIAVEDGHLAITVQDDGVGFDPTERAVRSRRLGLTSMFERAQALGGRLTIDSSPGGGTTVRAEVPLG